MRIFGFVMSVVTFLLGVINLWAFGIAGHWQNLVVGILDLAIGVIAFLMALDSPSKVRR